MCEQHTSCDSVAEGGNVLEEASFHVGELAVRDVRAAFFPDVLRGSEEGADSLDPCFLKFSKQ